MLEKLHEDYKGDPVRLPRDLCDDMINIVWNLSLLDLNWRLPGDAVDAILRLESPDDTHERIANMTPGEKRVQAEMYQDGDHFATHLDFPADLFGTMVEIVDCVANAAIDWRLAQKAEELLEAIERDTSKKRTRSNLSIVPDDNQRVN